MITIAHVPNMCKVTSVPSGSTSAPKCGLDMIVGLSPLLTTQHMNDRCQRVCRCGRCIQVLVKICLSLFRVIAYGIHLCNMLYYGKSLGLQIVLSCMYVHKDERR